ncbi:hypothetical protein DSY14_13295 [Nocardiopsis sp. MG754419]|nr:hypothetical protein [Nocardiopsis sp. MG754419]
MQTVAAHEELSIRMPGRHTGPKYMMAALQMIAHESPEGYFPAAAGARHVLHEEGIETAMPLCALGEVEDEEAEDGEGAGA